MAAEVISIQGRDSTGSDVIGRESDVMRAYACVRGEYPPYGGRGRVRTYACGLHTFSTRPDTYVRVRTHVDSTHSHFSHFASHFASHFSHFASHFSHFSSHFSHFASHFSHFASHSSHYGPIRPDGPVEGTAKL